MFFLEGAKIEIIFYTAMIFNVFFTCYTYI